MALLVVFVLAWTLEFGENALTERSPTRPYTLKVSSYMTKDYENPTEVSDLFIHDNSQTNDWLFYGDLMNMESLFLPLEEINDTKEYDVNEKIKTDKPINSNDNIFITDVIWDELKPLQGKPGRDLDEFNELTNITKNLTRRWSNVNDPTDYYFNRENKLITFEPQKKDILNKLNIQFIIHARYFLKRVFEKREHIRLDKRYKMGFLFNRLRKIRKEQLKMVSMAKENQQNHYRTLRLIMRLYEKVVRYDVDLSDLILLIKHIDRDEKLEAYFLPEMLKKNKDEGEFEVIATESVATHSRRVTKKTTK